MIMIINFNNIYCKVDNHLSESERVTRPCVVTFTPCQAGHHSIVTEYNLTYLRCLR